MPCIGMGTFGSDRFTPGAGFGSGIGGHPGGLPLMFDCAAIYGNEEMIGDVFQDAFDKGVVKREELFITTKVWNDMHGRGDVLLSCAKSLRDLHLAISSDAVLCPLALSPITMRRAVTETRGIRTPSPSPSIRFMATWRQCERLVDMGLVTIHRHVQYDNTETKGGAPPLPHQTGGHRDGAASQFSAAGALRLCRKSQGIQPIGFCPIGSPTRPDRDKDGRKMWWISGCPRSWRSPKRTASIRRSSV